MKGRTLSQHALNPDLTMMHLKNLSHNRQAQTGALDMLGLIRMNAIKRCKQLLYRVLRNANSLVLYAYVDLRILQCALYRNRATIGGVFNRVGEQVHSYLY